MKEKLYIHALAVGIESVLTAIKCGYEGESAMAVHACRGKLRITLGGKTIARGNTLIELSGNFRAYIDSMKPAAKKE